MHTIQLAASQWLVIDDSFRGRFLIVEGPVVLRETGETHIKHRVEWWNPDRTKRHVLAVCDGMVAAETWCQEELSRPTSGRRTDIRDWATPTKIDGA